MAVLEGQEMLVYLTKSIPHNNTNTLEKRNERLNSSNDKIKQQFENLRRYKRSNCDEEMYYDEKVRHCCIKCPRGEHVEKSCAAPNHNPICKPCEEGTFLAYSNYLFKCKRCTGCHSDTDIEEVKCSATTDAVCVCKENYYRHRGDCQVCTKCHNRSTTQKCSKTNDTQCGPCLPGFHEEQNKCQSCHQLGKQCENTNASCSPVCELVVIPTISVPYILTGAFLLLLLPCGGFLIHKHKRKKKHNMGEHVFTAHGEADVPGLTDINQKTRILSPDTTPGHVPSVLQKSCTLYDIIDCVPIRRWKEFMRTLELPDKVIEIVEVEISNIRDQQYEMLRRWCQLKMASVDAVYQTLERMNLSGCAEELKAKIEHYS
ncbi:tumor necrosis factor receptor superfamily member 25 [Rhinoderma darwinii]|uniref:tumor necrosis factor receptor superfamily member 25 n=1 Tax=Rhinoderma darwinii TaxID=43563 RepID=UPI003F6688AA